MLFEWWERYRRLILLVGAVLFLGSSIWWYMADQAEPSAGESAAPFTPVAPVQSPVPEEESAADTPTSQQRDHTTGEKAESGEAPVYVDVKGMVKAPGLYRFSEGMRVADAIKQAGGPLPTADLEQINLAQPLQDGSAIVIPAKRSDTQGTATLPPTSALQPVMQAGLLGAQQDATVNINTASIEELMELPGIGESKAQAIIEYREKKRPFRSPEELKQISGIGDKVYERLKDRVRVH